jgi:hypothetical protein
MLHQYSATIHKIWGWGWVQQFVFCDLCLNRDGLKCKIGNHAPELLNIKDCRGVAPKTLA